MSLSKELFGIKKYPNAIDQYEGGFNDCIEKIDQFELSEEELRKIIISEYYPNDERATLLAKQIKQNANKIFVRKSK